jgi:ribosomal protein S18 acetylase RimI-like enzyme
MCAAILRLRDSRELARYEIDPGLGAFARYSPRRTQVVRESLGKALRIPQAEVYAAVQHDVIVGYLWLIPPSPDQPWGLLNDRRIVEVGIEVARSHRGRGIARALMHAAFERPEVESRIHVATGYRWCWDLQGSGLAATSYASRLLGLFERFGFRREWTSEPNIKMDAANFLAVRIGREVPPDLVRRFRERARGDLAA